MELVKNVLNIQGCKQEEIEILYIEHVLMIVQYAQKIKHYQKKMEHVYERVKYIVVYISIKNNKCMYKIITFYIIGII